MTAKGVGILCIYIALLLLQYNLLYYYMFLLQVQMFSYQCSKYSTPESIVEVFNLAKEFQDKRNTTEYVSVVVLDEVGLAEDSPTLPLKALHPLLEDGTEGGDNAQQVCHYLEIRECTF